MVLFPDVRRAADDVVTPHAASESATQRFVVSVSGRLCPLAYRYRPEELAAAASCAASTLYVVGGLYGNTAAMRAVLDRAADEDPAPVLVFNGDFHYLDADPADFREFAATVAEHRATLGNIEAELVDPQEGAGCGCGYPDYVDDATVARSNQILTRPCAPPPAVPRAARAAAARCPDS